MIHKLKVVSHSFKPQPVVSTPGSIRETRSLDATNIRPARLGKVPLVDCEDAGTTLDDWLSSLQRAAD